MKIDWRAVARDALSVLVLSSIGVLVSGKIVGDADRTAQAVSGIVMMIAGFCIGGCLAKEARFKHLAIVALAVWSIGSILNFITVGAPVVWSVLAIVPVFVAMVLGGLASLAIVRTPGDPPSPQP